MKYIDEFRSRKLTARLAGKITGIMPGRGVNIMEVCGTHTMSFYRFGLNKILPEKLRLISGPGCPVCVSSQGYIDGAISLAKEKDVAVLTFGDMLRVPGSRSTLERERAAHGSVHTVYSPLDCLRFAKFNPAKKVVFLAVGFETTIPAIALTMSLAKKNKVGNLFFLPSLKLIPPAMKHLAKDKKLKIDGFLCPGHVSAIIGSGAYEFIAKKYKIGCCVAGFEPVDMLEGILFLLHQLREKTPRVDNQYARVVLKRGNRRAQRITAKVFAPCDAAWRGLGVIPGSGLKIRKEFFSLDAGKEFGIDCRPLAIDRQLPKCKCGEVLKGMISPAECPLFKRSCTPENPYGPCMVSVEGACNAYYRYR